MYSQPIKKNTCYIQVEWIQFRVIIVFEFQFIFFIMYVCKRNQNFEVFVTIKFNLFFIFPGTIFFFKKKT